ncbi:MAG: Ig-like domain-containing protein, partial [Elusimicrobia bacterium]|nr:Ig-like domain-containing protein [Elusimicrobiota bacterium]
MKNKKRVCLAVIFVMLCGVISKVSALVPVNFTRGDMFVTHWYEIDSEAKLYADLQTGKDANFDAVFFFLREDYLEAAKDPVNCGSWNTQASWDMLGKAIAWCHNNRMKIHIGYGPTRGYEGGFFRRWGYGYSQMSSDGGMAEERIEIAYPEIRAYELDLVKFLIQNYPTIDGIHFEEPQYDGLSYSTPINIVVSTATLGPDTNDTRRIKAMKDSMNSFWQEFSDWISVNRPNPTFNISENCPSITNNSLNVSGVDMLWHQTHPLMDLWIQQVDQALGDVQWVCDFMETNSGRLNNKIPLVPGTFIDNAASFNQTGCVLTGPANNQVATTAQCFWQDIFKIINWGHSWNTKALCVAGNSELNVPRNMFLDIGDPSWLGFTSGEIISNIPCPPASIATLSVGNITPTSVVLNWVAVGANGFKGTASQYDIRYATTPAGITHNWATATQCTNEPVPQVSGTNQSLTVSGLDTVNKTYYFVMKVADVEGNWSGISNAATNKADTILPSIAITSHSNGSTVEATLLNISGTASDDTMLSKVEVKVGAGGTYVATTGLSPWNGTVTLVSGSNTIYAKATDTSGNTKETSITVTCTPVVDTTLPTIAITSPANGATLTASLLTVSGTASDNLGLSKVEVKLGAGGTYASATGTNPWSGTVTLVNGSNTIYAKATDTSNNIIETSITVTYAPPDTTPPSIVITSPANSATLTASLLTVSGTASDNIGLSKVEVKLGAGGTYASATGTNPWSSSVTLVGGSNTIYAKATDTTGNITETSITVTYVPDTTPPTIAITSPANGAAITTAALITISGTAVDNIGINKVEVKLGAGGTYASATGTNPWNSSVTLVSGSNTIYAKATDTSNNIIETSITVTYTPSDTTAPSIAITSPSNGTTLTTSLLTLSGTANDNIGISKVEIKLGAGGTYASATGTNSWSGTVTLVNGSNTVYVKVTDTSNNSTETSISVTRVNTAPTISWTGETNYTSDGINPETGTTNTSYVYRVKYADADGDAPKTGYPRVHIKKGVSEITGSPFVMTTTDTGSYVTGRNYSLTKILSAVGSD